MTTEPFDGEAADPRSLSVPVEEWDAGGVFAPLSPRYEPFVAHPVSYAEAEAIEGAIRRGLDLAEPPLSLAGDERDMLAGHLRRDAVAALAALRRSPIESLLPKISAPRGGIRYAVPADFGPPSRVELARLRARYWWAKRRPVSFYRAQRARVRDARRRWADARAVWRGDKDAATTEEDDW